MSNRTNLQINNQKIVNNNNGLSSIKDKLTNTGLKILEPEGMKITPRKTTMPEIILADVGKYISSVTVMPTASATKTITSNGTHDVTEYTDVIVNVPTGSGLTLDSISKLPTANKYNVGCYAKSGGNYYKCEKTGDATILQNYTETLIGKTIKLDINSLTADGKLYTGGEYTASSEVYIDLVNANGSTYDAIRIQIKLKTVNGVNQIEEIYYLYYPGNTGYRYYWYCYGKTSADNTTTYKYFDDNTITFTTDNVQILSDYGFITSASQSNEWLKYLVMGETNYVWKLVMAGVEENLNPA